jgi:hypothetical protein
MLSVMGAWPMKNWLVLLVLIALASAGVWLGVRVLATPAPPSSVNLWAVAASDATHLVAVGGTRDSEGSLAMATSGNGGATWSVSKPSAPALTTLAAAGGRLIGGTECYQGRTDSGPIEPVPTSCLFTSEDGGQTWRDLDVGRLVDPSFIDASTGWAHTPLDATMSRPATLFATSDSGQSWQSAGQPCADPTPWIRKAVLVAPRHGYVLCRGVPGSGSSYPWQLLELTPDGATTVLQHGDTYAPGAPFDGDDVRGLAMLPDGHGYLLTQKIWRTLDGGRTWTALNTGETVGGFESITMVDDSTAFASLRALGNYTRIYGTTDGGDNWTMLGSWSFY